MKNFILIFSSFCCATLIGQVNSNQPVVNGATNENVFLDASTNFNDDNNLGKGLLFPRVDLTQWTFKTSSLDGINFPTAYDGMVVYNNETGMTVAGNGQQVSVTPGFYYFYNPNGVNAVSDGVWRPISPVIDKSIYTDNGTLTSNRTVNHNNNDLTFTTGSGKTIVNGNFQTTGSLYANNGQVKIGGNGTTFSNSAALEIESSNKGMLLPRVSLTSKNSSSPISNPTAGLMVYNTNYSNDVKPGLYVWSSESKWDRASDNIYDQNGSLTSNRFVDFGGNKNLTFTMGIGTFSMQGNVNIPSVFDADFNSKNVKIGSSTSSNSQNADSNAVLELASNNKGFLIPRIALTSTTSTNPFNGSPPNSILVYNTATANDVEPGFYFYSKEGSLFKWRLLSSTLGTGKVIGDVKTITSANYIIENSDYILIYKLSGNQGIQLPSPVQNKNRILMIRNNSQQTGTAGTITYSFNSPENTNVLPSGKGHVLASDGTSWQVITEN